MIEQIGQQYGLYSRYSLNRKIAPAAPLGATRSGTTWAGVVETPSYGRAVYRHTEAKRPEGGGYGPDGLLRGQDAAAQAELDAGDARMLRKLEQRDGEVRREAEAQGEAVGSESFIYQTGPDGERYAIGTGARVARRDAEGNPVASGMDAGPVGQDGQKLSDADEELLEKLKARDDLVRAHESNHVLAAGGQTIGLPSYVYQTGPDGRRYAIGGSVQLSVADSSDPEQRVRQARTAARAALVNGGEASVADMQTAAKASSIASEARRRQAAMRAYSLASGYGDDALQ